MSLALEQYERNGQVLREVRTELGLSQECVGMLAGKSRSWTNQAEQGMMRPAPEAMATLGHKLKDGRLIAQAARMITGGAFAPPVLDGESVDLHRSCVAAKLVEELEEAIAPARRLLSLLIRPVRDWSKAEESEVDGLLEQCLDAERAVQYIVISISSELGRDVNEVYWAHDKKLLERGYTRESAQVGTSGRSH